MVTSLAGGAAALAMPGRALAGGTKWETITREQGILVSTRAEEGRQFPSFRGILWRRSISEGLVLALTATKLQ